MEYVSLGNDDYLIRTNPENVDFILMMISKLSYDTAKTTSSTIPDKDYYFNHQEHIKRNRIGTIESLNLDKVNSRECYTKLQKMIGSNDYIFRGKHFERSGRNPEQFLDSVVKEIEKNK